ncbi:MAG: Thiol-disulfide oxidoreductase ResA [Holosporales bacterium]
MSDQKPSDENQQENNVVSFPNAAQPQPAPTNNKSMTFGIGFGIFLFFIYIFRAEFFPKTQELESAPELTLLDINFSPYLDKPNLPSGKLKFYEKSEKGEWILSEKSVRDLIGKPMILHCWATFCGPCVKELPLYDKFAQSSNGTIENVAVVVGKADPKEIETFYKQKNIKNLKIVIDEKNVLASAFQFQGIPTSIFVSRSGKPLGFISGMISWEDSTVVSLIQTLLKKQ